MKRLSTTYGFTPTTNLTPLAIKMLGSKKKDNYLNVLLLSLNDIVVCAYITHNMLDALCTGNLTPRKYFEPAAFRVLSFDASFEGTRLEDMYISILLQRNQGECDLQPMYEKEK